MDLLMVPPPGFLGGLSELIEVFKHDIFRKRHSVSPSWYGKGSNSLLGGWEFSSTARALA